MVSNRGKMMKNAFRSAVSAILGIVLFVLVFLPYGCCGYFSQPGETEAEGHRRHLRNLRINQQEMIQDIDRGMLFDKPAGTTDRRIE